MEALVRFMWPDEAAKPPARRGLGDGWRREPVADEQRSTYDVTYNDYPGDAVARLSPGKLMDAARDGLLYLSKGTGSGKSLFTFGQAHGREQEIAGQRYGTRYRIRMLLVQNRLYQLTAMARPPPRGAEILRLVQVDRLQSTLIPDQLAELVRTPLRELQELLRRALATMSKPPSTSLWRTLPSRAPGSTAHCAR